MARKTNEKNMKKWLGMPVRWEPRNAFKNLWNPEDDRIFPPKYFGIGWDLNLHAIAKKAGIKSAGKKG